MSWEVVTAVTGAVSAIAIAATVVYLAIQVRRNTLATHSQTYHLATEALAEVATILGSNLQIARIYRTGLTTPEELNEDEFTQFALLGISQFRRYENLYFQYRAGLVDEDFWSGHRENILWYFHRPGMQAWWKDKRLAYSKSFRQFLESSQSTDLESPVDRRV